MKRILKALLPDTLVYRIQQQRLAKSIAEFPARVVERNYYGHAVKIWLADNLAAGWYDRDRQRDPGIEFLKRSRLRAGARVFDLGAHQSVFAIAIAKEVGEPGTVISVEANGYNVSVGRVNLELNKLRNVHILHRVVSDGRNEHVSFRASLNGRVSEDPAVGERVQSITIDALAKQWGRPDVVIIDVEGYESVTLQGASETLSKTTDWLIEVHEHCGLEKFGTVEEILRRFPPRRFTLFIAPGEDAEFHSFNRGDPLPVNKFFLIARSIS